MIVYSICSSQHNKEQCNMKKEINIFCGYCRYKFDIWYLLQSLPEHKPLKRLYQFHNRNQVNILTLSFYLRESKRPLEKTESKKWFSTERPHYMSHYNINHHRLQKHQARRQWMLLKRLLWPKAWLYCYFF